MEQHFICHNANIFRTLTLFQFNFQMKFPSGVPNLIQIPNHESKRSQIFNSEYCPFCDPVISFFRNGYNFVVSLPVGAANVDVRQRGYRGLVNDDNYLAVKNIHGKYLLNGNFVVSAVEKDIIVKGSLLRYSGTGTSVETLQASRPLKESLTVELLSVGKMTPPRVRYSYYLNAGNKEGKVLKKEERNPTQNSVLEDSNKVELKEAGLSDGVL